MSNPSTSGLTGFGEEKARPETPAAIRETHRQSLQTLNVQGFCTYGDYPWDHWQVVARAAGVSEDLAALGRAVMREAHQHGWCDRFRSLCGWNDEGRRMIALALRSPKKARVRWEWLLDTDGQRVDPWANYEWVGEEAETWPQRRRRWLKERQS